MSLPATTSRTAWLNASDTSHLFMAYGPPGSGTPGDGDPVQGWQDEDSLSNIYMVYPLSAGTAPLYESTGINNLGSLKFDGVDDRLMSKNDAVSANVNIDTYITAAAYTVFVAFRLTADANDNPNAYGLTAIMAVNAVCTFGVHCKSSDGLHYVIAYSYSGGIKTVPYTILKDTDYVFMGKLGGGLLTSSVNNGVEDNAVCGAIDAGLGGYLEIGNNCGLNGPFPGLIGEILIYNTALSGADFTNTMTYMTDKWLAAAAVGQPYSKRIGGIKGMERTKGLGVKQW